MLEKLESKMQIRKWDWIPIVGALIYSVRVDVFINLNFPGTKFRKIVRRPRSIFSNILTLVGVSFSIAGFVMKYKYHTGGAFPWPFIVSLVLGLSSLITVKIPQLQFKKGLDKFKSLPASEQMQLLFEVQEKQEQIAEFKRKKDAK